jgi:hypothetical protein
MQNYSKVGGILSIVSGGLGVFSALMIIIFAVVMGIIGGNGLYHDGYRNTDEFVIVIMIIYGIWGFLGLLVSALAIVGGVFALKKKHWGMALAGSIAGVLAFFPCGVIAVIFTALGKQEFNAQALPRTV